MPTELDVRLCDYCEQPADSIMARVVPGDRTTKRVSLGPAHENCLALHYEAIDLLSAPSADIAAGVLR